MTDFRILNKEGNRVLYQAPPMAKVKLLDDPNYAAVVVQIAHPPHMVKHDGTVEPLTFFVRP